MEASSTDAEQQTETAWLAGVDDEGWFISKGEDAPRYGMNKSGAHPEELAAILRAYDHAAAQSATRDGLLAIATEALQEILDDGSKSRTYQLAHSALTRIKDARG